MEELVLGSDSRIWSVVQLDMLVFDGMVAVFMIGIFPAIMVLQRPIIYIHMTKHIFFLYHLTYRGKGQELL